MMKETKHMTKHVLLVKIGEEIPKNVIQEIAADHGGPIDIKETEPMRSQLLESILNGDYDRTENEEIPDISH